MSLEDQWFRCVLPSLPTFFLSSFFPFLFFSFVILFIKHLSFLLPSPFLFSGFCFPSRTGEARVYHVCLLIDVPGGGQVKPDMRRRFAVQVDPEGNLCFRFQFPDDTPMTRLGFTVQAWTEGFVVREVAELNLQAKVTTPKVRGPGKRAKKPRQRRQSARVIQCDLPLPFLPSPSLREPPAVFPSPPLMEEQQLLMIPPLAPHMSASLAPTPLAASVEAVDGSALDLDLPNGLFEQDEADWQQMLTAAAQDIFGPEM